MSADDVRERVALTPTEDLFMEVLAGRYRCGENTWTFEARHSRVAEVLSRRGLIWWKSGVIERTILAGLTDAGRAEALSDTYTPPALTAIAEAPGLVEALGRALREHQPTTGMSVAMGATCRCGYWNGDEDGGKTRPVGYQGLQWHQANVQADVVREWLRGQA